MLTTATSVQVRWHLSRLWCSKKKKEKKNYRRAKESGPYIREEGEQNSCFPAVRESSEYPRSLHEGNKMSLPPKPEAVAIIINPLNAVTHQMNESPWLMSSRHSQPVRGNDTHSLEIFSRSRVSRWEQTNFLKQIGRVFFFFLIIYAYLIYLAENVKIHQSRQLTD